MILAKTQTATAQFASIKSSDTLQPAPTCANLNCIADNSSLLLVEQDLQPVASSLSQQQLVYLDAESVHEQIGWIVLSIDGQVQYMAPRSEQFIYQYFHSQNLKQLPPFLKDWFDGQITKVLCHLSTSSLMVSHPRTADGCQLLIRLIPQPLKRYYFLILEEKILEESLPQFSIAALETLELTKREAEVLFWLAKDKSNAEVAKAIGCCEGTVRKHLENIYKKLGVQTRMGAVMTALSQLGLIK
jgi:DNA-binding CsgD family transcriptional regulator